MIRFVRKVLGWLRIRKRLTFAEALKKSGFRSNLAKRIRIRERRTPHRLKKRGGDG